MAAKAEIFKKYLSSTPANIQTPARSLEQVHADFLLFVKNYTAQVPEKIDALELVGSADEIAFYKSAMATLYHPVYAVFAEPSMGTGNAQLYKLRADGGTYRLETYGISCGRSLLEMNDAKVTLTDKSLTLFSNNGNSLKLERTGETIDVNRFVAGAAPLPVGVLRLTILKNGSLAARHHLVALSM